MLLVPKTKKETPNSAFTTKQADNIDSSVSNIDANLEGFVGTFNKSDKKKQQIAKEQYLSQLHQLKIGPSGDSKDKETKKKWQKIVGVMGKGIAGLFKGVASIVKGLAGKATGLLGFLLGIFILLKLGLLKTLIPAALDMLKTLVTGIIEVLPDIIKWAWDILKEWVPKLVNAFADAISDALGLKKDSTLRKIMPILVGIGAGLLTLYKVASMFGLKGGGVLGNMLKGFQMLSKFLIANPFVAAAAAIAAAGVGIYEFIKHSEDISKWAKENREEMRSQDQADQALIAKYKGTDLSKLTAKQYTELQEAYKRQDSVWRDIKEGFFTSTGAVADAVTKQKQIYEENNDAIFKLQMKKNLTDKEQTELDARVLGTRSAFSKEYWNSLFSLTKTSKKKMGKALSDTGKSMGKYWDNIKQGARDVWNKLPSASNIKEGISTSFQSKVQKMEDFFKPFSKRMKEIFDSIGETFSQIIDFVLWGIGRIPGLRDLAGIADTSKISATEFHIRQKLADPENVKAMQEYTAAKSKGLDTSNMEMSKSLKDLAVALKESGALKAGGVQGAANVAQTNNRFLSAITNSYEMTRKINGK